MTSSRPSSDLQVNQAEIPDQAAPSDGVRPSRNADDAVARRARCGNEPVVIAADATRCVMRPVQPDGPHAAAATFRELELSLRRLGLTIRIAACDRRDLEDVDRDVSRWE